MPRTGLFWFQHDLRLHDNPALMRLIAEVDRLICAYVVDESEFERNRYGFASLGEARWGFLSDTLRALDAELRSRGNRLTVLIGEPVASLAACCQAHEVSVIARGHHPGHDETLQWARLRSQLPHVRALSADGHTLFDSLDLPFAIEQMPTQFTPFRRQVDGLSPRPPQPAADILPAAPARLQATPLPQARGEDLAWPGGEEAALKHVRNYLWTTRAVDHYKTSRDALDDWPSSSKLSPWLANGSLSVRQVAAELARYEESHGPNPSTEHLYFELLWREFFQWLALHHGAALFRFGGWRRRRPLTSYYPQRLRQWCAGDTPWPIVNACMRQLNATGYMSNRGRQLVASAFVHELGLDWRYGAAYFQQQLIDHDVACNWGNWQYLAGVGADPRGHRHFDLEWQTRRHDPGGDFIRRWAPHPPVAASLHSVDAADWPLMPEDIKA